MKEYIDKRLNEVFCITYDSSIDDIIKAYDKLIKEFEDKYLEKREDLEYFYKQLFVYINAYQDIILTEEVANHLIRKLSKKQGENGKNDYYMPIMDILMLTAIQFESKQNDIDSVIFFKKAVKHSEDYIKDAKRDFYNAYCCALGWLGTIAFRNNEYKECIEYNEKVLDLYKKVKDLKGFYLKEYDPNNSKDYIKESKKRL